jgi:glycosyltransferase involved in cell wall biosynthesis
VTAPALHVVICNERLLPRFGVDRLLLLLGNGLVARGHRVTFVCQRCDRSAAEAISPAVFVLPALGGLGLHEAEAQAARWLAEHWQELSIDGGPDVVVTGGWPFFRVAEVCARLGVPSIFVDAGAIPHEGLSAHSLHIQRELRRVRAFALPRFTGVLPISNFIRDSQTLPERGKVAGVRTILPGADHLETPMFAAPSGHAVDAAALAAMERLSAEGRRLVISLGRFESEGYKNSPAAYDVLARILVHEPDVRLLLLAQPEDLQPPASLRHAVLPLGFVSDSALGTIMPRCALGLSMSQWEGFNLPLAEMQWCSRPVLAFNLGAHPEVVADPWLLCGSLEEMADKAIALLQDGLPPHIVAEQRFERFRKGFRWRDIIARYADTIEGVTAAARAGAGPATSKRRVILVECSNAAIDPGNPGVLRVARRLSHVLQRHPELCLVFARWDLSLGTYRTLSADERTMLGSYDGPGDGISSLLDSGGHGGWPIDDILIDLLESDAPPVLFLPEVVLDGRLPERIAWARARGMLFSAILYDLIPVTHAPFCSVQVVDCFPEYLESLAAADAVWAISGETLREFELYLARHNLPRPPQREAISLPAQLAAQPRVTTLSEGPRRGDPIVALCVASLDPRKNHRTLIEAFRALVRRRPYLPLQLVLAGNRFHGSDDLAEWITAVVLEEPRITCTGLVKDAELTALFERATFTVYPSLVEGYGLPVVESLWMGRPCLCHCEGVMAELAADGGCFTVDMTDTAAIERALERLAGDVGLRRRLAEEATRRKLLDWDAYGAMIGPRLHDLREIDRLRPHPELSNGTRSPIPLDGTLPTLQGRLREEADVLRGLGECFVRLTDVPVEDPR